MIHPKTGTYEAVKMDEPELRAAIEVQNESLGEPAKGSSPGTFSAMASRRYWVATVSLITRDPPGYKLVQSNHRLRWSSGPSVRFEGREKTTYAGCPTPPGTCWRTSYSRWREAPYYIDGGRTLVNRYKAGFYNYNYGNPSVATIVQHWSSIYAYNSSRYEYYWSYRHRGEGQGLLRTQVVTK